MAESIVNEIETLARALVTLDTGPAAVSGLSARLKSVAQRLLGRPDDSDQALRVISSAEDDDIFAYLDGETESFF